MSQKFRASTQPGLEVYHDESNGAGLDNKTFSNHNHSMSSNTANSNQQYKPTSALHPSQSHPSSPIYDPAGLEVDQTGNNAQWDAKRRAAMEVKHSSPIKSYPAGQYANRYREKGGKRRILGLTAGVFWAIIALSFLLLAGAVGGGIGGGLAAQKKSSSNTPSLSTSSSSRPIPTSTTPSPSAAAQTSSAPLSTSFPAPTSPCDTYPSSNGTILTAISQAGSLFQISSDETQFQLACNTNFPAGAVYGNPDTFDLMHATVQSMEECVTLCGTWNSVVNGTSTPTCAAVALVKKPGEFCYLKSDISGANNDSTTSGLGVKIDTAILLD